MKKLILLFTGLFLMAIAAQNVYAQNPQVSANATANATIITVISIAQTHDLSFGNIISNTGGGTVTIANNGTPSYTGVSAPTGNEGTRQQAIFHVGGLTSATYAITLPESITISDGGTNNMTVANFTSTPDGTGALAVNGQDVNVGATLTVGAGQLPGVYTGSFTVTVAYN